MGVTVDQAGSDAPAALGRTEAGSTSRWTDQATVEPLVRCTVEEEERRLFDFLEPAVAERLERRWRRRLERLSTADLRYHDGVAFASGRRG